MLGGPASAAVSSSPSDKPLSFPLVTLLVRITLSHLCPTPFPRTPSTSAHAPLPLDPDSPSLSPPLASPRHHPSPTLNSNSNGNSNMPAQRRTRPSPPVSSPLPARPNARSSPSSPPPPGAADDSSFRRDFNDAVYLCVRRIPEGKVRPLARSDGPRPPLLRPPFSAVALTPSSPPPPAHPAPPRPRPRSDPVPKHRSAPTARSPS